MKRVSKNLPRARTATFAALLIAALSVVVGCGPSANRRASRTAGEGTPGAAQAPVALFGKPVTGLLVLSDLEWFAFDPDACSFTRLKALLPRMRRAYARASEGVLVLETEDGKTYACRSDGTALTAIDLGDAEAKDAYPSPGLDRVATLSGDDDKGSLRVSGTEQVLAKGRISFLAWSPAGDAIYYMKNGACFMQAVDAGAATAPKRFALVAEHPAWLPDGSAMVAELPTGEAALALVAADGSKSTRLAGPGTLKSPITGGDLDPSLPSPSPDGSRVAFCGSDSAEWQVAVTTTQGAKARIVSPAKRSFEVATRPSRAVWSPDGERLAFIDGNHIDGYKLFVVPAAGRPTARPAEVPFKRATPGAGLPPDLDMSFYAPSILCWR